MAGREFKPISLKFFNFCFCRPLPQTVWMKSGTPIRLNDRMTQGNYGKSLVIKHVTFEDEGDYTCEASNGVGDAKSYSINLRVMGKWFYYYFKEGFYFLGFVSSCSVFYGGAGNN